MPHAGTRLGLSVIRVPRCRGRSAYPQPRRLGVAVQSSVTLSKGRHVRTFDIVRSNFDVRTSSSVEPVLNAGQTRRRGGCGLSIANALYRHHNLSLPCVLHGGNEAQNALHTSRKCDSPVPAQPNTRRSPSRKSRRARSLIGLKDALGARSLADAEADAPRANAETSALDRCARASADQNADEVFRAQSSYRVPGSYEVHGAAALPIFGCAICMPWLHGLALHVVSGWQSMWPSSPSAGYLLVGVPSRPC